MASRPLRTASATAAPTTSGVVAKGASFHVGGHLGADEAGPYDQQVGAGAGEAGLHAFGERVEPGLRGAVDVIGAAAAQPRDRGEDDDRPVPLGAQPLGGGKHGGGDADQVGAQDVDGVRRRRSRPAPDRRGSRRRPAPGRCRRARSAAAAITCGPLDACSGIPCQRAHLGRSRRRRSGPDLRHGRLVTTGQHHLGAGAQVERGQRRQRELRRPAEHQRGLDAAERVVHVSPNLRERSLCRTPPGSSSPRSARHSVEPRIHRGQQVGPQPAVLGKVDAPAGLDHELVQPVEQRAEPGQRGRYVDGEGPARHAETTAAPGCPARSA